MKAHLPVDDLPQFKGLSLQASHLMFSAKAHSAKGEPFEAAVRWVEAGKTFADLAQALAEEGYMYAAAQDFLSSAHCFLEAGDYRPAEASLERLDDLAQLKRVLAEVTTLCSERRELNRRCKESRKLFEQAQAEAGARMGRPGHADRLSDAWLTEMLAKMPGVPECHWLMARKDSGLQRVEQAIDHFRLCCRLKPEHVPYRVILVERLLTWKRWDEAAEEAEQALVRFRDDPMVRFFAGWTKVQQAINHRAPKRVLSEAKELFESALGDDRLSGLQNVCVACSLSLCLARLGRAKEAERILRLTARNWPIPASDLAWELLRLKPAEREARVLASVPDLLLAA